MTLYPLDRCRQIAKHLIKYFSLQIKIPAFTYQKVSVSMEGFYHGSTYHVAPILRERKLH